MDEAAQRISDTVLEKIHSLVGDAWVDPERVDVTLRAKFRPGKDEEVRFFGVATVTFAKIVVTYEFNLGERIVSRGRG